MKKSGQETNQGSTAAAVRDTNSVWRQNDAEFITRVWEKIGCLEQKKMEYDLLQERKRSFTRRKCGLAACFLAVLTPVTYVIVYAAGLNQFSLMLLAMFYLGSGLLLDAYPDISVRRHADHELSLIHI